VARLPRFEESMDAIRAGVTTGSTEPNRRAVAPHATFAPGLTREERALVVDPQTSGGLLLAVPADAAERALADLRSAGLEAAARIGEVADGPYGLELS
jgi:selenide,water dikinase